MKFIEWLRLNNRMHSSILHALEYEYEIYLEEEE